VPVSRSQTATDRSTDPRDDASPVRAHRHGIYRSLMPCEPAELGTGFEVPDRHGAVLGPRDDASPVRAHRHGIHCGLMPGEPVDWRAGFEVPDRHCVVFGSRDDVSAVGANRHRTHRVLMPDKNSYESGRFTQGSPTKDQRGMSEVGEPAFGVFGQASLPQSQSPEKELLGEAVGLELRVPLPKTMAFALEDTKASSGGTVELRRATQKRNPGPSQGRIGARQDPRTGRFPPES